MGKVIDIAFFAHAKTCGMDMDSGMAFELEKSCCDQESFTMHGQDDLKLSFDQLSVEKQIFLTSFVYSYSQPFEGLDENITPFKDYSPPPLIRDVQILHQTFLI